MSDHAGGEVMAALLDALTDVREQLEEVGDRYKRTEANQAELLARLDAMGAAGPELSKVFARMDEDRAATDRKLALVAQVAALAHAAAVGNGAPLPSSVTDEPLLELYVLSQPADRTSTERALVDWQRVSRSAGSAELADALARQYRPSPTDTVEIRRLRYRLAAISREELEGRGAMVPPLPPSTFPADRSAAARDAQSAELARMWRAGESINLYADPELAGAMDIFAEAQRQGAALSEAEVALGLADLHRTIATSLEAGDRPELATRARAEARESSPEVRPDRVR